MPLLTDVKDVVLIGSSLTTMVVTLYAINKWKKEHRAKIYFDCAYKCLKALYTIRDNFSTVRSSMIASWEFPPNAELSSKNQMENYRYIFKHRLQPLQEALNQYYSLLPEVEVLFSKDLRNTCNRINAIVNNYHFKLNEYLQLSGVTNNTEYLNEITKVIYKSGKGDKFEEELNGIIGEVGKSIQPYLTLKK